MVLARRSLPGRTRFREELELCRKKRTNRMLIAMVVIFAICWLPLNIVHMVAEFHRSDLKHYKVLFLSTHVIAMSSTIYNPFLYSWLNDNFRKEFQALVPCLFKFCSCFREDRTHPNPNGDVEIGHDRMSANHLANETPVNGKTNGCSPKKFVIETIPLTSIKSGSFIPESSSISNQALDININGNDVWQWSFHSVNDLSMSIHIHEYFSHPLKKFSRSVVVFFVSINWSLT